MSVCVTDCWLWHVLNKWLFVGCQVSSLAREKEKDSYRLSWGTENLDNVALSSSPIHSG